MQTEADRIRAEYASRDTRLPADKHALSRPENLFAVQEKGRALLTWLSRERLLPLDGKRILDVGCGDGHHLLEFVTWGASRGSLAAIDLIDSRVERARARIGCRSAEGETPDIRAGDASRLPWASDTFDIVHQGTMFTSILDPEMKGAIAREIVRVLKPGGVLFWYDFMVDNPRNPNVRGIRAHEIRKLFTGCQVSLKRITLAPPIARKVVPVSWVGSLLLEKLVLLNTHYLGLIRKPDRVGQAATTARATMPWSGPARE